MLISREGITWQLLFSIISSVFPPSSNSPSQESVKKKINFKQKAFIPETEVKPQLHHSTAVKPLGKLTSTPCFRFFTYKAAVGIKHICSVVRISYQCISYYTTIEQSQTIKLAISSKYRI